MNAEQVVEVNGFAYRWSGEPLAVGDRVMLPENWLSEMKFGHGPFMGTVTSLTSTYNGDLSTILRRASDSDLEAWSSVLAVPQPMHPDPAHLHEVRWTYNDPRNLGGSYVSIDVRLECGCEVTDIRTFAADMRAQKGWEVATTVGWSGWGSAVTIRVRSSSLYSMGATK